MSFDIPVEVAASPGVYTATLLAGFIIGEESIGALHYAALSRALVISPD